ncbi:MAG: 3-deoxy-7-phosphoheptulonate synthase [Treponema sp.]|jgi:3-deoxy-7-phosphoheptulonate synthase|nr:3-deoxy-7-phosphoheptulonate synthase [Treponema sp.]
MVIVLKQNASEKERNELIQYLGDKSFKTNIIKGEEKSIVAAVGTLSINPHDVELLAGVERVIPISKPYKMASREFKPEDTVIEIKNNRNQIIRIGGQRIISIAGPCAVENRYQMMEIAKSVAASGACMLRGGAYKPRSSPYSFQGLGEEGLILLKEAGDKYGLPVVTEVVASEFLPVMEKHGVDVYQVGARNMQNFELLKNLGKLNKPVILKRGLSATIEEWLMSAEYLLSSGTDKVILCERGIRTYEKATRNTLDLSAVPVLRGMTHLPIIVDPSHALGIRDKIPPMALASIAAGADGIIVEVHNCPEKALSDGPQALLPKMFDKLMSDIEVLAPVVNKSVVHIREAIPERNKASVTQEHKIRCAYSGKKGAYAEQAISRYFDTDAEVVAVNSFREIFQSVVDGTVDFGMVPIENTLAGSVYQNYDNLTDFNDVEIVGAVRLRIQHALLGMKGAKIDDIKTIYSHPQALTQCSKFISSLDNCNLVESVSTATAAQMVSSLNNKSNAAIASEINADYYKLEILQNDIEDDPENFTRFIVIKSTNVGDEDKLKMISGNTKNVASIVFTTKNEPGALYNCLGVFQDCKLNLTRLESRPVESQPWHYWFYADVVIDDKSQQSLSYVQNVINKLKSITESVRLLGLYSEADIAVK